MAFITDDDYGYNFGHKIYGTWDWDIIWAFGGDDTIIGNGGGDTVYAGEGDDIVYADEGTDHLFGDQDNDALFGFGGDDFLYGGYGTDELYGGTGQDELWGGPGRDRFAFQWWDSGPSSPDLIKDFEAHPNGRGITVGDTINVLGPAGTASNYDEFFINYAGGYDAAKGFAEAYIGGDIRYMFVTDQVDGYFFSDADGNGIMENGIVLEGLSNLFAFSHQNIVDIY